MKQKLFLLLTALAISIGSLWADMTDVDIYNTNLDYCKVIRTNAAGTYYNISIMDKSGTNRFHARGINIGSATIINGIHGIPRGTDDLGLSNTDTYAHDTGGDSYSNPSGMVEFRFTGRYDATTNYPIYHIIIDVTNNNRAYLMHFDEELPVKAVENHTTGSQIDYTLDNTSSVQVKTPIFAHFNANPGDVLSTDKYNYYYWNYNDDNFIRVRAWNTNRTSSNYIRLFFWVNDFTKTYNGEMGPVEGIYPVSGQPKKSSNYWSNYDLGGSNKDATLNRYVINVDNNVSCSCGSLCAARDAEGYLSSYVGLSNSWVKVEAGREGYMCIRVVTRANGLYVAIREPNTFTVAATSNNDSWGTVSGNGVYYEEATVTVAANPQPGYHFVSWSDGGAQSHTITINSDSKAPVATFAADDATQYTITVQADNDDYCTVSGGGTYFENSTATLTATSKNEHLYFFDHWEVGGSTYAGGSTITPTVTGDATYTAVFRVASNGTITTVADHGTVSGGGDYNGGAQVSLEVTPDDGYSFTQWSDGNTDNPRTVYVDGDATYTAEFMYGVSLNLLAGCSPSSPLEYRVLLPDYEIYFRAGNSWSYGDGEEIPLSYINTSASYIKDHGTTVTIGNDVYAYTHTEGDRKILELNFTGSNGKYYQIVLRGANYATDCTQNFDQTFTNLAATSSGTGWRILSADNGVTESAANAQFGPNHWDIYLPVYIDESKCGSENNGVPSGIYPILDTDAEGTIRATIANSPARASGYWTCQGINQMH